MTEAGNAQEAGGAVPSREGLAAIAANAAAAVPGVHQLATATSRRERAHDSVRGVRVQLMEGRASFDVSVIAESDTALLDLASAVRRNVIDRVEAETDLRVTEVNVRIDDLLEIIST